MYKSIPTDIQAKALGEALTLSNVKTIASKYNISEDIIYRKYNILRHLLPFFVWLTPKKIPTVIEFFSKLESSSSCPSCGCTHISKNGKLTLVTDVPEESRTIFLVTILLSMSCAQTRCLAIVATILPPVK